MNPPYTISRRVGLPTIKMQKRIEMIVGIEGTLERKDPYIHTFECEWYYL